MIGFMQGRLSPLIDGKIQAFPWPFWQNEFEVAQRHNFHLMEWTLDHKDLHKNPLMTESGRKEIRALMATYEIAIVSLTGDCFMQEPFFKSIGKKRQRLLKDLVSVIEASARLGIGNVMIPLVDNGKIESLRQEEVLREELIGLTELLKKTGIFITFESGLDPKGLLRFVERFDSEHFGLTYDIGNSACLGYHPREEIALYGHRIVNVHVKDRLLGGTTVPLGRGNADIPLVLTALSSIGYQGNYILQTARADNGNHAVVLCRYRDFVQRYLETDCRYNSIAR